MKKIFTILALTLALTAVSFSAKTDTKKVFTFEGHQVESTDVFSIQEKNLINLHFPEQGVMVRLKIIKNMVVTQTLIFHFSI